MIKPNKLETVEILTKPLYPEQDGGDKHINNIMVRELPTDTIIRRLDELKLTRENMSKVYRRVELTLERINIILNMEEYPTYIELNQMLHYVGLELTAIPTLMTNSVDGHWFVAERCQYCGVNVYDASNLSSGLCSSNPTLK